MKCLCCNSNNIVRRGQKPNYEIFHCKNCKFEFVYPLPSYDEIQKHYNKTRVSKNIKQLVRKSINEIENNPNSPMKVGLHNMIETRAFLASRLLDNPNTEGRL